MKRMWIPLLLLTTGLSLSLPAAEPVDMAKRAQELKNLRWGMFICWSFSTFSGKEWTPGVKDVSFFKATEVDTDQWAKTAKEAGMGYILFLTKHHDGFCLWDTKTTDRRITKAPLGRDVLADLKKSCDKHGIKLALYFSEGEFNDHKDYHPGGYTGEMKKAQLRELLTQYGPVEFIWFDTAVGAGNLEHRQTIEWCKSFQPGCFIGFNHGDQTGCDLRIGEMGRPSALSDPKGAGISSGKPADSYLLSEFTYPIIPDGNGTHWFYSKGSDEAATVPADQLYQHYLGALKYGNIFSLDVGPNHNGKLRELDVATLRKVGEMIKNPPPVPPAAISRNKPAKASSTWDAPGYEADKAFDDDDSTRWGAAKDVRDAWLEVDLQKETRISRAVIKELGFHRTQEFAIEYKDGEAWKELAHGTVVGGEKQIKFPPVAARQVRLNILKASDTPTIEEFQVF